MNENLNDLNELNDLRKIISDLKNNGNTNVSNKMSKEELLKKFFIPRNNKETIRILPKKQGEELFNIAYFHVVTTNASGGKKKHGSIIYCPNKNELIPKLDSNGNQMLDGNGNPIKIKPHCPICEKYEKLISKQDNSIRNKKKEDLSPDELKIKNSNDEIYKEAIKWEAKKFYILKVIDRGRESDGVKFWRFKHNYKKEGTLDKLLPILDDYVTTYKNNFTDVVKGVDLNIFMSDSEFNGKKYKAVSTVQYKNTSLLHNDELISNQWCEDTLTWKDVFKPKSAPNITPHEFLEMIVKGENPYWDDSDQNRKHWVFPNRPDLEEKANTRNANLDGNDSSIEQEESYTSQKVNINNITSNNVGSYKDDSVNFSSDFNKPVNNNDSYENIDDFDDSDLPF